MRKESDATSSAPGLLIVYPAGPGLSEDGSLRINLNGPYYGEVAYTLSYQGKTGEPFPWLFVDAALLNDAAETAGYTAEFLSEDENDQYLVRLMPQGA